MDNKVIDLELGMKLVGNRRELAEEMLRMLAKNLPAELDEIKDAKSSNNYPTLLKRIHKLHGAVCYCGVPSLKSAIVSLETALKQNDVQEIPQLYSKFEVAAEQVIKSF